MADENNQQPQGHLLVTPEMEAEAAEAADFKLPRNEDVQDEENNADKDPDTAGEKDGDSGSPDTEVVADQPQASQDQIEYVDDPGEFVPGDYSFDVTIYDAEGKNGRPVHVTSIEQWDELLEKEPNLGTSGAVGKAFRAADRMERNLERDKQTWEAKKAEYDQAVQAQEAQSQTVNQWVAEMDYLIGQGELPPISPTMRNADWSNPTIAKDPAVKAQIELLNYMRDENTKRAKFGLNPITSVLDAYQGFARARDKQQLVDAKKQAGQVRRAQAERVSGSAPRPATAAPRGISVGRVGQL